MINNDLRKKLDALTKIIKEYGSFSIALSGGIDSTFLLTFAKSILRNKDSLLAITAKSVIHFNNDLEDAIHLTQQLDIHHLFFNSQEMNLSEFTINGKNRCYVCKKHMLKTTCLMALKKGFKTVVHGANLNDVSDDYCPGLIAADEMGVMAPLVQANFSKEDIRSASRIYGIDTWDKPAMACAATRFPYGSKISINRVKQVKRAELILSKIGFTFSRVRHYGDVARIEIKMSQASRFADPQISRRVVTDFKKIGYNHVLLDLEGYKRGKMNQHIV